MKFSKQNFVQNVSGQKAEGFARICPLHTSHMFVWAGEVENWLEGTKKNV
jgi:hypothetical protein